MNVFDKKEEVVKKVVEKSYQLKKFTKGKIHEMEDSVIKLMEDEVHHKEDTLNRVNEGVDKLYD